MSQVTVLLEIERVVGCWESVEKTLPTTISKLKSKEIPAYATLLQIYLERQLLSRRLIDSAKSLSTTLHQHMTREEQPSYKVDVEGGIFSIKSFLRSTQIFTFFLASLVAGASLFVSSASRRKKRFLARELKARLILHAQYMQRTAPEDPTFVDYKNAVSALIVNLEREEAAVKDLSILNLY